MAEEQDQDPAVEQVAAPAQQSGAQELRRIALPAVLVLVEADQAAHHEHGQADVGIDLEEKAVDRAHLAGSLALILLTMRTGWRFCPATEQPSKAGGSAQLSSSAGSARSEEHTSELQSP